MSISGYSTWLRFTYPVFPCCPCPAPLKFVVFLRCTTIFCATMPRPKANPDKRGRKPWIFGTKTDFFSPAKDEWVESCKAKTNAQWSRLMAIRYYIAYGDLDPMVCSIPFFIHVLLKATKKDLEATPPMPTDSQVTQWQQNFAQEIASLSPEEAKCREDEVSRKAKVHIHSLFANVVLPQLQTILGWYRHTFGNSKDKQEEVVLQTMIDNLDGTKDKPRRTQLIQMYTNVNWEHGLRLAVKTEHDAVIAAANEAYAETLKTDPNASRPEPEPYLSVQRRIVNARWNQQSETVRQRIKDLVDEKWAQDQANYEATKAAALSPARYQK